MRAQGSLVRSRRLGLRALLAAAATPALLGVGRAQTPAPVVLHHIGPLSGVLAASNGEALQGARLFLDAVNRRGGVGGRLLQLQARDDAQDPRRTVELFEATGASMLALLMPRTTPSMEALLPAVARLGVPVVGPQTGASFVNQPPRRELFTLRASYRREAEVAIRQQHAIGARRFAVLLADDAFGRDTFVAIERTLGELQVPVAAVARIDNRQAEVAEAVAVLRAAEPQVVLLIVSSKAAAATVRAFHALGSRATFVSLSNTSNLDYVRALGEHRHGAIVMQVMPSPFSPTTALAREYLALAQAAGGEPSYAGLYGCASARLVVQALQRVGPAPDKADLLRALESLGEVDLGGFRVRYGAGDRTGSNFVDSTIITAEGRFRG